MNSSKRQHPQREGRGRQRWPIHSTFSPCPLCPSQAPTSTKPRLWLSWFIKGRDKANRREFSTGQGVFFGHPMPITAPPGGTCQKCPLSCSEHREPPGFDGAQPQWGGFRPSAISSTFCAFLVRVSAVKAQGQKKKPKWCNKKNTDQLHWGCLVFWHVRVHILCSYDKEIGVLILRGTILKVKMLGFIG